MKTTLKGTLRYDGAHFAGWQVQPGQRTIQGVLEEALSTIAQERIQVLSAGRTDAGVHALGQVFSCPWPAPIEAGQLRQSLGKMLSPHILVTSLEPAPAGFHATHSAVAKRYVYCLADGLPADPFSGGYVWALPWKLDMEGLAEMAQKLVGRHDFAGFACSGSSTNTTLRTVKSIQILQGGLVGPADASGLWRIEYTGDGFLYKMVRNMTGTLVNIARGHIPESRLDELLNSPSPYHGFTAPAKGLFLAEVFY